MSTQIEHLVAAYKVAVANIQGCVQKQAEFIEETARELKVQAVRAAAPPESQGLRGLSSALGESDKIEELRALMAEDLAGLSEAASARYEAFVAKLPR